MIKLKDILNEINDDQLISGMSQLKTVSDVEKLLPKIKSVFSGKLLFGEFECTRVDMRGDGEGGSNDSITIILAFNPKEKSGDTSERRMVIFIPVYADIKKYPAYLKYTHMTMDFAKSISDMKPKQITKDDGNLLVNVCKILYPKISWSINDLRFSKRPEHQEIEKYIKNPTSYKPEELEKKPTSEPSSKEPTKKKGLFSKIKSKFNIFK
jgi:hypothetical protein